MSHIRKQAIAGLKPGDSFTVSRTFTEQDTLAYADISRDYNPVHFDDRFASAEKFPARICHGLLVASLLTEIGGHRHCPRSATKARIGSHARRRRPHQQIPVTPSLLE